MNARCPDFAQILRTTPADAETQEQIVVCFYEEMSKAARHICRDGILAEDAVQEAMATGLRVLHTYRGDAPLQYWLRKLVVSSCNRLRRGRKNNPRLHVPLAQGDAERADAAIRPAQEMEVLLSERLALLAEALSDVPEPNRSLLLRHEGEEVPLKDLADELELSVEAVKARLKRTRAQVRASLLRRAEAAV